MALRNCPFCKSAKVHMKVRLSQSNHMVYGIIICDNCGAMTQWSWDTTKQENKRFIFGHDKHRIDHVMNLVQKTTTDLWNGSMNLTVSPAYINQDPKPEDSQQLRLPFEED